MKILWVSDSPNLATGYGVVTKNIVPKLVESGFETSVLGLHSVGQPVSFGPYLVYPRKKDPYGADILPRYLKELKPDILITLGDIQFFHYLSTTDLGNTAWIPYYPMDGIGMPLHYRNLLRLAHKRIAMSKHTKAETEKVGLNCEMIYHGVDTSIFKPALNKEKIKEANNFEGKFIIGSVARNQLRKMTPRLIQAFKEFSKNKKDVLLLIHSTPTSDDGNNLIELFERYNLRDKVMMSEKTTLAYGLSDQMMNNLYNVFDIHALATSGEGFGLIFLESMACGIPNVATDITTSRELIEGRGELAKVQALVMGNDNIERGLVDIKDFADKLEILYDDKKKREEYSKKSIEFAKQLDWKIIGKEWKKVLESIQ